MTRKNTVVVAGVISALLLGASATFAVASGLFGSGRAEQVGTFQAIEQRLNSSSVPATTTPRSPARTLTPPPSASATSSSVRVNHVTAPDVPDSNVSAPVTSGGPEPYEQSAADPSTTSTSGPANHEDHPDSGRASDD